MSNNDEEESRRISNKRHDIFLSFHGSEQFLDGKFLMRQVATNLNAVVLQRRWEGHFRRRGRLSIFFDDHSLRERSDGRIDNSMFEGLLQTRGGGICAILATQNYFKRTWCLTEMLAALKLDGFGQLNICLIAIGISVEEIKGLKFVQQHGNGFLDRNPHICHAVQLQDDKSGRLSLIEKLQNDIADIILGSGKHILPGETEHRSFRRMKRLISSKLGAGHFEVGALNQISNILGRDELDPDHLLDELKEEIGMENPLRHFITAFENKWRADWCADRDWITERDDLKRTQHVVNKFLGSSSSNPKAPLKTASNGKPDLEQSSDSSTSDCSGGFVVSLSLSKVALEANSSYALQEPMMKARVERQLAKLLKYGTTVDEPSITVERLGGRDCVFLECDINFEDMKKKFRGVVNSAIESLERILINEIRIPQHLVKKILFVSFNEGSIEIMLQMDSSILESLFDRILRSPDKKIQISDKFKIVWLSPVFVATAPFSTHVQIHNGNEAPDVWLWKQHELRLLCPTSSKSLKYLMEGGVPFDSLRTDRNGAVYSSLPSIWAIPEEQKVMYPPHGAPYNEEEVVDLVPANLQDQVQNMQAQRKGHDAIAYDSQSQVDVDKDVNRLPKWRSKGQHNPHYGRKGERSVSASMTGSDYEYHQRPPPQRFRGSQKQEASSRVSGAHSEFARSSPSSVSGAHSEFARSSPPTETTGEEQMESQASQRRPAYLLHRDLVIGKGSYGQVCVASRGKDDGHSSSGRSGKREKFACKCVMLRNDQKYIARLQEEVNVLREVRGHENIIRLFDVFCVDNELFIITELGRGGDLFHLLTKYPKHGVTEAYATKSVAEMLSAVAFLHSRQICHRDLKLENWVLESGNNVWSPLKLIDFGLATHFTSGHRQRRVVGSSYYVAPEVLKKSYTESCDLWSLGVIVYMLLSGAPPFYGRNDEAIKASIMQGEYTFPRELFRDVSDDAMAFVSSLLVYNPEYRYTAEQAFAHPWLAAHLDPERLQKAKDGSSNAGV